ncbi:MAG TPA: three-Cys-motif partner protein TcmP [Aggregatilineaceae bacterium]|nr:three-Cys-motif partner protein TcmP [Aggregatilineaceae bacterium]
MVSLDSRDPQTIVKHEILGEYLVKWGGIIINGLRRPYQSYLQRDYGFNFTVRFVYLDCFASVGRYAKGKSAQEWVPGSPLIGIHALDAIKEFAVDEIGLSPEVYTILFEEKPANYDALLETLQVADLEDRVRQTTDFFSLNSGEIAAICCDYRQHIETALDFTGREFTWAFYFLDPYGPKGMELDVVGRIVSQDKNDVMINFPYQDLHRKTGSVLRGTPEHEPHLRYWDEVYGDDSWREIVRAFSHDPDMMETKLVQEYANRLQDQDQQLAIKTIPLRFKDKERTMFYLFLTTHDPTGGLAINQLLSDAKQEEHNYRVQWKTDQLVERALGYKQQRLPFESETEPELVRPSRPSKEEIAEEIYRRCQGQNVLYREVLRRIVNGPYFPKEVESAMRLLKRQKRANFERSKPQNDDTIEFKA